MLVKILSADVLGVDAYPVEVEVDVAAGLPGSNVVGLAATAVTEGLVRLRAALGNSGFQIPPRRITVNLAPGEVRKDTTALDLPMALALLAGTGVLAPESLSGVMALGELGLDGSVRAVRGALSVALAARHQGVRLLLVPRANGPEVAMVPGLAIRVCGHVGDAVAFLRGEGDLPVPEPANLPPEGPDAQPDMAEVRGQEGPKRAMEVAVAGGHNVLLVGPPGSGKSMLARRLPGLLPPLELEEALEVTKIYSVAGLLGGQGLVTSRPFRAPHHTVSTPGLVGGGPGPRPGEVSLAHLGVLFLDEVLEFRRGTLEALRQPLEEGSVTITRARGTVRFPAAFMLAAAMNPCPCGHLGDPLRACVCSPRQVALYRSRLSGPLLDRIDLQVEVPRLTYRELREVRLGERSEEIRARVVEARARQAHRFRDRPPGGRLNAAMGPADLERYVRLDEEAEAVLKRAVASAGLSARAVHRVLKVARTIADLEASGRVTVFHVAEAVSYRNQDQGLPAPEMDHRWAEAGR